MQQTYTVGTDAPLARRVLKMYSFTAVVLMTLFPGYLVSFMIVIVNSKKIELYSSSVRLSALLE